MALQDLTPQLRTRLSRVERAVGWFVIIAALLLVSGFVYYAWHTAVRKGWFLTKVQYQTGINNAAGLNPGDPVKLMGFNAGEITKVVPNDPKEYYGVTVFFSISATNSGYVWSDSTVKVSAELLGKRYLEVTKGKAGLPTVDLSPSKEVLRILKDKLVRDRFKEMRAKGKNAADVWSELNAQAKTNMSAFYSLPAKDQICWVEPNESPAINERLENIANQVEEALPNIVALTNLLTVVLDQGLTAASNANTLILAAQPTVDNLAKITEQISDPHGSLGDWLFSTNLLQQLSNTLANADVTLGSANTTLTNADAQVTILATELDRTLEHLSSITSNLNSQVAANTNLVKEISDTIVHADELLQGLKRHWLLRSAFKTKDTGQSSSPATNPKAGKLPQK